jgi:hypothetical protein
MIRQSAIGLKRVFALDEVRCKRLGGKVTRPLDIGRVYAAEAWPSAVTM